MHEAIRHPLFEAVSHPGYSWSIPGCCNHTTAAPARLLYVMCSVCASCLLSQMRFYIIYISYLCEFMLQGARQRGSGKTRPPL